MWNKQNDVFTLGLNLQSAEAWLLLMFFIFLTGAALIGTMLMTMAEMVQEKNEMINGEDGTVSYRNLKLIPLTFNCNKTKFKSLLQQLHPKSIQILQQWFRLDFTFMFFIYPCLSLLVLWLNSYSLVKDSHWWFSFLQWFGWLPFIAWLFDLLENTFALSAIRSYLLNKEVVGVGAMRITSALKWLVILAYLIPVLIMLVHEILLRFDNWFTN